MAGPPQQMMRPGVVASANEDGTYRVIPAAGRSTMDPVDGVRCIPTEAAFEAGDAVMLVYLREGERPWILVTGGNGGAPTGYLQGVADLGFAGCIGD